MLAAGFSDVTLDLFFRGGNPNGNTGDYVSGGSHGSDRKTIVSKSGLVDFSYLGDEINLHLPSTTDNPAILLMVQKSSL